MDIAPILLVEDDFLIRATLAAYLRERGGFTIVEADDATEALAVIEAYPRLSILVTDIQIPGVLNGVGVAAAARRKWPDLPVLYVTGAWPRDGESTGGDKRDSYVEKPFEVSAILRRIRTMLHGADNPDFLT